MFTEGTGSELTVNSGDDLGSMPKVIAQYPTIRENDKSFVFNPTNRKYYLIRGTSLNEFDPVTQRTKIIRSPVTTVAMGDNGNIVFASPDRQVGTLVEYIS